MVFDRTRKAYRNRAEATKKNLRELISDSKDRSFTEATLDLMKNSGEANRQLIRDLRS